MEKIQVETMKITTFSSSSPQSFQPSPPKALLRFYLNHACKMISMQLGYIVNTTLLVAEESGVVGVEEGSILYHTSIVINIYKFGVNG